MNQIPKERLTVALNNAETSIMTKSILIILTFFTLFGGQGCSERVPQTTPKKNETYTLIVAQELQGELEEGIKVIHDGNRIGLVSSIHFSLDGGGLVIAEISIDKNELIPENSVFHFEYTEDYLSRIIEVDYSQEIHFLNAYDTIKIESRNSVEYQVGVLTENLNVDSLIQDSAYIEFNRFIKGKIDSIVGNF